MSQDLPPPGGFPTTIRYQRYIPKRGPSGAIIFSAIFGIVGYGAYQLREQKEEQRHLKIEKAWARIHLIPLLQAEADRDMVRRISDMKGKEAEIMKNVENWTPFDLKAPVPGLGKNGELDANAAEPVYHTSRYVAPNAVFLPMDYEERIPAQLWRGTKWFSKNPPFHERWDWKNKENGPKYEEA